jgi:DNA-binding HxlR family transcriptional regulator
MTEHHHSSNCAVAKTLALLGDKWTLLVVRELMLKRGLTFKVLTENINGIRSNILSDRLKRLMEHGLLERHPYQERPPRYAYTLTKRGVSLRPILIALAVWGADHLGGEVPDYYRQAMQPGQRRA